MRFNHPTFSPLELGLALDTRDVGHLEYWGAAGGETFEQTLLGYAVRNLPPVAPEPTDALVAQRVEARRQEEEARIQRDFIPNAIRAGQFPEGYVYRHEFQPGEREALEQRVREQMEAARARYHPITESEWRAGIWFREGLEYENGMTAERAEGVAEGFDRAAYRDWIRANHDADWLSTTGAIVFGLAAGLPTPENFIPILGPGIRAAAVGRLGAIGGRVAVGAVEGAAGSAISIPIASDYYELIGREYTTADIVLDLAIGAAAGSALGLGAGLLARRSAARAEARAQQRMSALQARQQAALTDLNAASESLNALNLARERVQTGIGDIPPPSRASIDAALRGLSVVERRRFALAQSATEVVEAGEINLRTLRPRRRDNTITQLEEAAIHGETQEIRDLARTALERSNRFPPETPRRVRQRIEERIAETPGEEPSARPLADVVRELQQRGVDTSTLAERRVVPELTPIERMAIEDRSKRVRDAAYAEIDRRLAETGTTETPRRPSPRPRPEPAQPNPRRDPAEIRQEIQKVETEQGIDENGDFAEMEDWKRMDEAGELSPEDREAFLAAEQAMQKAQRAPESYEAAAMCAAR